jgi:protein-S-isoprenylcysteine O-methyltransferase Ste14
MGAEEFSESDLATPREQGRDRTSPDLRRRRLLDPPFSRRKLRPKALAAYSCALLALVVARPTPATILLGLPSVILGQGLRLWATGYLVKTEQLTVVGPYAHLRHPLYAGTLLIGIGFALAIGMPGTAIALGLGLPYFFFVYLPYKERIESDRLEQRYEDLYRAYRSSVRSLMPRFEGWRDPAAQRRRGGAVWGLRGVVENNELGTLTGVLMALAVVLIKL